MHSVEIERVPEIGTIDYMSLFEGLIRDGFNVHETEKENCYYLWRISPTRDSSGFIAKVIIIGIVSSKTELMEVYSEVLQQINEFKSIPPQERAALVDGVSHVRMNHFWISTQLSLYGTSELAWTVTPLIVIMDERIVVDIPDEIKEISVLHTNLDEFIRRDSSIDTKSLNFKKKWAVWRKSRKLGHYSMFTLPGFGIMTMLSTIIPSLSSGIMIGMAGIIASMLMLVESVRLFSIFQNELYEQIQYVPAVIHKVVTPPSETERTEIDIKYEKLTKYVSDKVNEAIELFDKKKYNPSALIILEVLETIARELNPEIKGDEDPIIDGILNIFTSAGMGLDESYETEFIRAVNTLRQAEISKLFPFEVISPYVIIARMLMWLGLIDETMKNKIFDVVNKPALESLVEDLTRKIKSEEEDDSPLAKEETGELKVAELELPEAVEKEDAPSEEPSEPISKPVKEVEMPITDSIDDFESDTDLPITDIDSVIEEIIGKDEETTVKEGGH